MEAQIISLRDITKNVSNLPIEELWSLWRKHVQILEPFWQKTTEVFAERLNLANEKRNAHIDTIKNAFNQMDDWRFQRVKYIKARRNEIESAISFIRNKALEKPAAKLAIAPVARNAASALRVFLTASCRGYSDKQLPECFAHAIYDIAAVHILFPFNFGDLSSFHPGHANPNIPDPFIVMLERSGQQMGVEREVQKLFAQVHWIWNNLNNPAPLNIQDTNWSRESDGLNAKLHYASQAVFHRR